MNSFDDRDKKPEHDKNLKNLEATSGQKNPDHGAELSRDEIARQIVLDALRSDRPVLETSAATAFRDFSYAHQA
ncbi:hypothetical protein AB5J49_26155 [Streptomyces sp. R28]|uniref:Uncharacterized protein n=1 Tax=Streptomyces sp. R28 TaxID=3238628 RepID=A0AB39PZQ4_9ACTN